MHPDAKNRKKQPAARPENGRTFYNSKNSQASLYKPSDAENIDKAEASCTKFINELEMDSEVSGEHVLNLQNIELEETGSSKNGKYDGTSPQIAPDQRADLNNLMNEIDSLKVAIGDIKSNTDLQPVLDSSDRHRDSSDRHRDSSDRHRDSSDRHRDSSDRHRDSSRYRDSSKSDDKSRSNNSSAEAPNKSDSSSRKRHKEPTRLSENPVIQLDQRRTILFEDPATGTSSEDAGGVGRHGASRHGASRHGAARYAAAVRPLPGEDFTPKLAPNRAVLSTESNNSSCDNSPVIHLYPQPPPGRAATICVTAR